MSAELLLAMFENIAEAIRLVKRRCATVESADDFMADDDGLDKLDAVSMRLQVIGEELKNVEKKAPEFLERYPEVEWKKVIGLRDVISHHYVDINAEIIFDICKTKIPPLDAVVSRILEELEAPPSISR